MSEISNFIKIDGNIIFNADEVLSITTSGKILTISFKRDDEKIVITHSSSEATQLTLDGIWKSIQKSEIK